MTSPTKRAVVIGAGAAGLIALRELVDAGVDATAYEAAGSLGGVYARHRVYEGALLTTSSNMVAFGCFPAPHPAAPVMWTADEYVAYLEAFVAAQRLAPRIRFGVRVTEVRLDDPGAGVAVTTEPAGGGAAATEVVDAVVVCSGLSSHAAPVEDALPGIADFKGAVLHSSQLCGAAQLAGKRVLVVGAGESGSDVCLLAARVATAAALSTRTGPGYVIPRYVFDLPSDVDTSRAYHSLPRWLLRSPWHRAKLAIEGACLRPSDDRAVLAGAAALNGARRPARGPFQRFGCKNTSIVEAALRHGLAVLPAVARVDAGGVTTTDGAAFACDTIVVCTGYRTRFPFLERAHPELAQQLRDVRGALYKRVLHPALGVRVAFVGFARPGLGAIPPLAELQARYTAAVVTGAAAPPPPDAMRAAIAADAAADVAAFPDDARRVPALCDYASAMDALAGLLGVRPSLRALLTGGHVRVARGVLFSSLSGAQFRLHGPGAAWAVAAPALAAYPTLPLPVLLWEAAALVACAALAALGVAACSPVMRFA